LRKRNKKKMPLEEPIVTMNHPHRIEIQERYFFSTKKWYELSA